MTQLRSGYTTGSCAAAAAKAASMLLKKQNVNDSVIISLPNGGNLNIPIAWTELNGYSAKAEVIKDGGDDPDITNGLEIWATVKLTSERGNVNIRGGTGIGVVTKKGLAVPVGQSAINPGPYKMIITAVREIFPKEGIEVLIEVPKGSEVAKKTLNSRLGIVGGISILGTSGIVRPMSEEAFKASILPELDQALAYGHESIVFTPGNYGYRTAVDKMNVSPEAIVQTSNFIGFLFEEALKREFKEILLIGHIGKLIKVSGGIFHTHNRIADARMEILLAHAALTGIPRHVLIELSEFPTIEGAANRLIEGGHGELLHKLAAQSTYRVREYTREQVNVGTIFTLLNGDFVGWDKSAQEIIRNSGWKWPRNEIA